jgi:hypothetical protein
MLMLCRLVLVFLYRVGMRLLVVVVRVVMLRRIVPVRGHRMLVRGRLVLVLRCPMFVLRKRVAVSAYLILLVLVRRRRRVVMAGPRIVVVVVRHLRQGVLKFTP